MPDDFPTIARLLAEHFPCGEVSAVTANPGRGFSEANLYRVKADSGTFALRSWEASAERRGRLEAVFDVIRFACESGCGAFLSLPLATRQGEWLVEQQGRLWQLSRWLEGQADFNQAPSLSRLEGAVSALARFHQATARLRCRTGICNAIPCRLVECRAVANYLEILLEPIQREPNPRLQRVAWELWQRIAFQSQGLFERGQPLGRLTCRSQPIFGDAWHDNLIFDGARFSGFIDYTAVHDDAVSVDLARLLGSLQWEGRIPWDLGLTTYEAIRPLTEEEKKIIPWLHESGLVLGGLNWLKWNFVHRIEFPDPDAVLQRMQEVSRQLLASFPALAR